MAMYENNRLLKSRQRLVAALALTLLVPSAAPAQTSEIAELWRELDVVRRQWRAEYTVLRGDIDRFRARRAARRWRQNANGNGQ
jgi:hypothetical protein